MVTIKDIDKEVRSTLATWEVIQLAKFLRAEGHKYTSAQHALIAWAYTWDT